MAVYARFKHVSKNKHFPSPEKCRKSIFFFYTLEIHGGRDENVIVL